MLFRYLRDRLKLILLFAAFLIIISSIFYLENLQLDAVYYSLLLCGLLAFLVMIYDFYLYYNKHKILLRLRENINVSIEDIPKGSGIIEKDFIVLIEKLFDYNRDLIFNSDISKTEMIDFYTLWVHQIKTPIAAMSVLLQEEECNENSKLKQELFKIERYVEIVLQYLRLDSLGEDLNLQRYDLNKIVNQSIRKYAPMFIHKKIKLDIENFNIKVLTDEKWLTFVVEQLISNALKYTNSGIIKIFVKEEKTLVIEDSGIGISEEDIPRVFERGFTGFNGRMDKKSTGLGLYLCREILKKLNHKIYITSKVGHGTRVSLDLASDEFILE